MPKFIGVVLVGWVVAIIVFAVVGRPKPDTQVEQPQTQPVQRFSLSILEHHRTGPGDRFCWVAVLTDAQSVHKAQYLVVYSTDGIAITELKN